MLPGASQEYLSWCRKNQGVISSSSIDVPKKGSFAQAETVYLRIIPDYFLKPDIVQTKN